MWYEGRRWQKTRIQGSTSARRPLRLICWCSISRYATSLYSLHLFAAVLSENFFVFGQLCLTSPTSGVSYEPVETERVTKFDSPHVHKFLGPALAATSPSTTRPKRFCALTSRKIGKHWASIIYQNIKVIWHNYISIRQLSRKSVLARTRSLRCYPCRFLSRCDDNFRIAGATSIAGANPGAAPAEKLHLGEIAESFVHVQPFLKNLQNTRKLFENLVEDQCAELFCLLSHIPSGCKPMANTIQEKRVSRMFSTWQKTAWLSTCQTNQQFEKISGCCNT